MHDENELKKQELAAAYDTGFDDGYSVAEAEFLPEIDELSAAINDLEERIEDLLTIEENADVTAD
jgi:hypothetical protein